jgi:DNA-binding MarR family transcriptional regulator
MSVRGPVPPPTSGTPQTLPEDARAMVRTFLSEEEEGVWLALMESYDGLLHALDNRLLSEHNLSLSTFEAIMHITHAQTGAISISELAERIRLSPSQVSRIAMELERKGLIERHRSEQDSRSTEVAITDAGRVQLQAAAPTYLKTIHARLFDPLTERDVKQLARIWQRIQAASRAEHSEDNRG